MINILETYIGIVILVMSTILFAKIVLNKQIAVNKIMFVIVVLISALLYDVFSIYLVPTAKSLCIFVLVAFVFKYIFDISLSKSLFVSFLCHALIIIPDFIAMYFCLNIIHMSKEYCYEVFAGSMLSNLMVSTLFIVLTYLFRKPLRKLVSFGFETNKKIILFSILTLISVLIFGFKIVNTVRVDGDIVSFVFVIIVLVLVLISLLKQKRDNDKLASQYNSLLEFMKQYEAQIENQRIIRHETKNQLLTIKSKIVDKDKQKETLKYIDKILGDNDIKFDQEKYAKFQYLPSNGIKGLFYFKTMEAEKNKVMVDINVSPEIEKSYLKDLNTKNFKELGQILGVYLDNAIEASYISRDKKMGIELYVLDQNIEIIISNSYDNKIDDKVGNVVFSTKGKNRGHGLLLVKSIIKSNKIFEEEKIITDKLYIQKLIIKN